MHTVCMLHTYCLYAKGRRGFLMTDLRPLFDRYAAAWAARDPDAIAAP